MAATSSQKHDPLADAMERYVDGDPRGFREVYAGMAPVVGRCLRRWVGDPTLAEDLVQETFVRVHRARARYRRGAPVGPWVLTIARRLSIDALRRKGRSREKLTRTGVLPDGGGAPAGPSPAEVEEVIAEVQRAVRELPPTLRDVVAMHKIEGRPLAEVATILGIKEGAARVRAHRGYQRLKKMLSRRNDGGRR